ncbi:MAG: DUF2127 domain-containing protein [Deltaproteobacteria bacterium]|nr:DUF2127 domain-containing protein [Deltaproteobacteria bacterium]
MVRMAVAGELVRYKGRVAIRKNQVTLLRLIAIFKLLKVSVLLLSLAVLFKLVHAHDPELSVFVWAMRLRLDPGAPFLQRILAEILRLDATRLELIAAGTSLYATLFLFEGIGLWFGALWAEYLTIVATGGFIPVEVYEIFVHDGIGKLVVFALNVLIVIVLVVQVRRQ